MNPNKVTNCLDKHSLQPDASLYLYAARAVAMQMGWPAGLHFIGTPSLLHTGRRSNLSGSSCLSYRGLKRGWIDSPRGCERDVGGPPVGWSVSLEENP